MRVSNLKDEEIVSLWEQAQFIENIREKMSSKGRHSGGRTCICHGDGLGYLKNDAGAAVKNFT
jgi:hypothetical protein